MLKTPQQYFSELNFDLPDQSEVERQGLNSGEKVFVEKYLGWGMLEPENAAEPEPQLQAQKAVRPSPRPFREPRIEIAPGPLAIAPAPQKEDIAPLAKAQLLEKQIIAAPPAKISPKIEVALPATVASLPKTEAPHPEKFQVEQAVEVEPVAQATEQVAEARLEPPFETIAPVKAMDAVEIAPAAEVAETKAAQPEIAPTKEKVEVAAKVEVAGKVEITGKSEATVKVAVPEKAVSSGKIATAEKVDVAEKIATTEKVEVAEKTAESLKTESPAPVQARVEAPQAPPVEVAQIAATSAPAAQRERVLAPAQLEQPKMVTLRDLVATETSVRMVSFYVSNQLFLLPVAGIHEVLRHMELIKVPQAPYFIAGAFNLRGSVIPLVHMSALLTSQQEHSYTEGNFIIVYGADSSRIGLIIDKINSMHMLDTEKIIWNVESRLGDAGDFLCAIANLDERVCGIVAPEMIMQRLLSS